MIFEGRPLRDITDQEIEALIKEHTAERQHLEFKATYKFKDHKEKKELLRDIVSLANGGGGYLIIGIKDNGKGQAQDFAPPDLVDNFGKLNNAILNLSNEHIRERIDGLQIESRSVSDHPIILVRVPVSSRRPHMVALAGATDFVSRYHDGKRDMTISEIKAAFNNDLMFRAIEDISRRIRDTQKEQSVSEILHRIEIGGMERLNEVPDGKLVMDIVTDKFQKSDVERPWMLLAAVPLETRSNSIDSNAESVRRLLASPPETRRYGWTMDKISAAIRSVDSGVKRGDVDTGELTVLNNGFMQFSISLDEGKFYWAQEQEEIEKSPRLSPYAMTEYPVSFIKLFFELVNLSTLGGPFLATQSYKNLKGHTLPPGGPSNLGYVCFVDETPPCEKQFIKSSNVVFNQDEKPDQVAYDIVKQVYAAFGYEEEAIPFFDDANKKFVF